jgi:hypothetical protein
MNADDVKVLIVEDVRCDIYGDLYGHDRVAESIAWKFSVLFKDLETLTTSARALLKAVDETEVTISSETADACNALEATLWAHGRRTE